MSFTICSWCSRNYYPALDFCLPSWYQNSGASRITLHLYDSCEGKDANDTWFLNAVHRCKLMRDAVREAAGTKLLLLDADCIVMKELSAGFSETKPIGVARWPRINMGVLFLNMTLDWPFVEFFDKFVERLMAECDRLKKRGGKWSDPPDQAVLHEMLHEREGDIEKLDAAAWNYCTAIPVAKERIAKHGRDMKILHLRIRSTDMKAFRGLSL